MVGHFTKHLLQKNSSVSLAFPNKQVQSSIHFSASNPLTIVDSMGFCPWAPALGGNFYTPNFPLFFSFWRAERSDRWASCMASWRFCLEHCKCPFVCFSSWHLEVVGWCTTKFWPNLGGLGFDEVFGLIKKHDFAPGWVRGGFNSKGIFFLNPRITDSDIGWFLVNERMFLRWVAQTALSLSLLLHCFIIFGGWSWIFVPK